MQDLVNGHQRELILAPWAIWYHSYPVLNVRVMRSPDPGTHKCKKKNDDGHATPTPRFAGSRSTDWRIYEEKSSSAMMMMMLTHIRYLSAAALGGVENP